MARPTSKRPALLLTALALSAIFAGLPAVAHGPDTAGWIEQAGNGSGDSKPVIPNLEVGSVLYSAAKFPVGTAANNLGYKYLAFGTRPTAGGKQLFMTRSNNGVTWDTPSAAVVRDPDGQNIPLIIGDPGSFDVVHLGYINFAFRIWYTEPGAAGTTATSILIADSNDGLTWVLDGGALESSAGSLVGGTGFKSKIIGPSDVHFFLNGSTSTTCGAVNPWNCTAVMLYTTADPSGNQYVSMAWSPDDGITFTGRSTPILSPGTAGAWDDKAVSNATVQAVSASNYRLLYAGNQTGGPASIGTAAGTNGVTFTKGATDPATPASLLSAATPVASGSLIKAQYLADASSEHTRVYTTRVAGAAAANYLGATAPAPGTAPHIRVASPEIGAVLGPKVPISIYVGDTLGAMPGLNLQTLTVTIDGVGGLGLTTEDTIVGQFKLVGKKISGLASLADGPHTLVASVADLDGEITTVTVNFTVDALAPNSTITLAPTGTEIGLVDSPGKFAATVIDPAGGTGIDYVTAQVTNPLGQIKRYTTHAPYGWLVTKVNASHWNVVWTAPTLDPHFAVPGDYLVSILGTDKAGNVEKADTANSAQVFVL